MDLLQHFLDKYDRYRAEVDRSIAPLTDAQLRSTICGVFSRRAGRETRSPAAWHLWRLARGEDSGFARLGASEEVIQTANWLARLQLGPADLKPRSYDSNKSELAARIDVAALRDYWQAVGARTREILPLLAAEHFEERIGGAYVHEEPTKPDQAPRAVWINHYRGGRKTGHPVPTPAHTILEVNRLNSLSLLSISI